MSGMSDLLSTLSPRSPVLDQAGLQALAKTKKSKAAAQDFEAQFLGSMFNEMVSQLKGEGPLGDEGIGAEAFRGMLTDQLGKSVARAGGIGIAPTIYHELLTLQARTV